MNIYGLHQSIGMIAISLVTGFLALRISKSFAAACLYTLLSAAFSPQSHSSAYAMISAIGVTIIVLTIGSLHLHKVLLLTISLITANSLFVISFGYGMFNASSVDNSIIAMALPLLYWKAEIMRRSESEMWYVPYLGILIALISIVLTQGSTAYFVIIAAIIGWNMKRIRKVSMFAFPILSVFALGFLTQDSSFLDSNGRVEKWILFMNWWRDNANVWIGTGTGTFWWRGPAIQGGTSGLFTFMHNEYLQAVFEQGIIGSTIYLTLFIDCVRKSWHNNALRATMGALSVVMLTQFPFRFFASQLFIVVLIRFINEQWRLEHGRKHK